MMTAIRKHRLDRNMTLKQVADGVGVSITFLGEVERNDKNISAAKAQELAELYGVTIDDIFLPATYAPRVL